MFRVAGLAFALTVVCVQTNAAQPETSVTNLSLVALDNHGQPVTDLTADDFEVTDAGKPRKIAFVRHIERRFPPGPALGPNEFSNRAGGGIPHATVILLDLMNQRFNTRATAANQIVRYLQTLESADYLYLYFLTIDGRIYRVRGLPGAEQAVGGESGLWTRQIKQTMDTAMRAVLRTRPVDMDVAVRVQLTFAALESLATEMSRVPGRKNIVWVTDGVPITLGRIRSDTGDIQDFTPLLRKLSAALDRSQIAIYPSRQIMIGSEDEPPDAPGVRSTGNGVLSTETLDQFAQMTGGRPDGGRDIGAAVAQAMNDARTSYQLGYYAPLENWDGKFHKLRVTCKRNGVRVQAKTGYYAWPEDPDADGRQEVRAAVLQPFDAGEIGVRAALTSAAGAGTPKIKVVIDARDVAMTRDGDRYKGQLLVAMASYGSGGAVQASPMQTIDLDYAAADRDQVLSQGINYAPELPASQNLTSMRFIVFDQIAHTTGSVTIPLAASGSPDVSRKP